MKTYDVFTLVHNYQLAVKRQNAEVQKYKVLLRLAQVT